VLIRVIDPREALVGAINLIKCGLSGARDENLEMDCETSEIVYEIEFSQCTYVPRKIKEGIIVVVGL
jgi:hypothetical protein